MSVLWWLNLLSTFAVFSAVTWALYQTRKPRRELADVGTWTLWSLVHLGIAMSCLILLFNQIGRESTPGLHIIVLKTCLAVRLLVPWNLRSPI